MESQSDGGFESMDSGFEMESSFEIEPSLEVEPSFEAEPEFEVEPIAINESELFTADDSLEIAPESEVEPLEIEPEPANEASLYSEAKGESITWEQPETGSMVGLEQTEIYHSPETIPEKEPGSGPKASFDSPPDVPPENMVAVGMLGLANEGQDGVQPDGLETEPVVESDPEPDLIEPEPMEPDPIEPDPIEPEPIEPDPIEPDPIEPEPEPFEPEPEPAPADPFDTRFPADPAGPDDPDLSDDPSRPDAPYNPEFTPYPAAPYSPDQPTDNPWAPDDPHISTDADPYSPSPYDDRAPDVVDDDRLSADDLVETFNDAQASSGDGVAPDEAPQTLDTGLVAEADMDTPVGQAAADQATIENMQAENGEDYSSSDLAPAMLELSPQDQVELPAVETGLAQSTDQMKLTFSDPKMQAEFDEWQRGHDPANWDYKFGSPHDDYQLGKDLDFANQQHQTGLQAATADSLPDAIDTALAAHTGAQIEEETPMDTYFHEKYGYDPYTTDAYPKEEEIEAPPVNAAASDMENTTADGSEVLAQGMLGLAQEDTTQSALEPGDWSLPKNVSPSEIKVIERPDGKTSIVYGDDRDENGKIIGTHGHTVLDDDGNIDYARTQKGTVKIDTKK